MGKETTFEFENDVLKTYEDGEVAVIKVKGHVFDTITDLAESGKFISFINIAERAPHIKALLITCLHGCFNEAEYDKFLQRIMGAQQPAETSGIFEKIDRTREINILNRVITQLVEFKKISIMALQGHVVTPFFGSSLAADFRYASEDMEFSLAHLKYAIHPGGALPFFLQKFLGHSKAVEVLFRGDNINAKEALQLGLVNAIFPLEDFEALCMKKIHELCRLDLRAINTTKLLVNYSRTELRSYFDIESALLH